LILLYNVAVSLASTCKLLYDFIENPAFFGLQIKHRARAPEQDDLLRPRLVDLIDLRHELGTLTVLIN
jgi:hypothetical protein